MNYGYVRISTKKQSVDRQIRNIKNYCSNVVIIEEEFTGTTMNRPQWNKLMKLIKPNDLIIFDSVSRMARNAEEGFKTYETLYNNNIDLVFLKEPQINTKTYKNAKNNVVPLTNSTVDFILEGINKYLLELAKEQIKLAFDVAQKEVDDLHQRTKEGLISAKLNGKVLGHRKNTPIIRKSTMKLIELIKRYALDTPQQLKDCDIIRLANCSKKTYYKYKKMCLSQFKKQ